MNRRALPCWGAIIAIALLVSACNLRTSPLPPTFTQAPPTGTPILPSLTTVPATATPLAPTFTPAPTQTATLTATATHTPFPVSQAVRITFPAESVSAVTQTPILSGKTANFVLAALAGQMMTVIITSPRNDVFLSIFAANGTSLKQSSDGLAYWSGKLPATQDYIIEAVATGKDTTFRLQVIIPPLATAVPVTSAVITAANVNNLIASARVQLNYPNQLTWSLDSRELMAVDQAGINLIGPNNAALALSLPVTAPDQFMDSSPDGSTVAVAASPDQIELRELLTWKLIRTLQLPVQTIGAVFSPDGHTLAVTRTDKIAVDLYNTADGSLVKEVSGFQTAAPVYGVHFSADGRYLIWISRGTVQAQEIASGKLGSVLSHQDFVSDAVLTPDGKTLVTLSAGQSNNGSVGLIQLWNPADGSVVGSLTDINGVGSSLTLSPDGSLLAAGAGKTFAIWDLAAKKKLVVLNVETDAVSRLAFSPDGRVLASASADGWVRLWRIR